MRTARGRAKTLTALGIITMLFGALLVVAPGAAADHGSPDVYGVYGAKGGQGEEGYTPNLGCGNLNDGGIHDKRDDTLDDPLLNFGTPSEVDGDFDPVEDSDPLHLTWSSGENVGFVIVKQANFSAVFVTGGVKSGTVYVALAPGETNDDAVSHVTFCAGAPPDTGSLTVDKTVTRDGQAITAGDDLADLAFGFTVDCGSYDLAPADVTTDDAVFTLKHGDTIKTFSGLPVGTICKVTETNAQGATTTTMKVDDGAAQTVTEVSNLSITKDNATDVVVVNDFVTPQVGKLQVDKVVTRNGVQIGAQDPLADDLFPFTVDCGDFDLAPGDENTTDAQFSLTHGAAVKEFDNLPVGTNCTVTETGTNGASSTTIKVGDAAAESLTSKSGISITAATKLVTVTNEYTSSTCTVNCGPIVIPDPPEEVVDPANLTIVKAVTGEVPEAWSFSFNNDVLGDFDLTNEDDRTSDEVDAGEYTITEAASDDADLVSIACTGIDDEVVDLDAGTVTVDLDEGDSVTCTFTNDFPEVEPGVVVNPPDPEPAAKPTEVLGSQVVRSLPRTGSSSQTLATVGAMLILFGAVLTLGSRRKLALER